MVVILAISLALTLARSILVVDAVLLAGRISAAVAVAVRFIRSHTCTSEAPSGSLPGSRRQQAKALGTAGSSRVRYRPRLGHGQGHSQIVDQYTPPCRRSAQVDDLDGVTMNRTKSILPDFLADLLQI